MPNEESENPNTTQNYRNRLANMAGVPLKVPNDEEKETGETQNITNQNSKENDSYDPLKYIVNPFTAPGPFLDNCALCAVSIFANLFYCLYKDFKTVFNNDESVISRSKAGGRLILAALIATALVLAPLPTVAVAIIATVAALAYSIFYASSNNKQEVEKGNLLTPTPGR